MPELPEVETIRRELGPTIIGTRVREVWSHDSAKFVPARTVTGHRFDAVNRKGKYLILSLDGDLELIVHLGMTGQLRVLDAADEADQYVRARWFLDDDRVLEFRDVRRFGRLRVVPAGDYTSIATLHALGPEPFASDFTPDGLWNALRASNRRIKTQLLSQRPVAGVGNIYADEALWRAQIYPARRSITRTEAGRLHPAIVDVLEEGVANGGTTLRDYRTVAGAEGENQHHLDCYGRAGHPCPRCEETLVSRVWDARTTTFCPVCQPRR